MDTSQEKICPDCLVSKILDEFPPWKYGKNGKDRICGDCRRTYNASYRLNNKEKVQTYLAATRKERLVKRKISHEKNREKELAYRIENRERTNARQASLYTQNPSKYLARNAAWEAANPGHKSERSRIYRAQKKNAPINDLTHAQWLEIQAAQAHRCYYCGKRRKGKLTQDHIIPLSKGGSHTLANVIAACRSCNSRKFTGPPPIPVQLNLLTEAPPKPYKPRTKKDIA